MTFKISSARVSSKARTDGEWVKLGDEYDNAEIKTRGFTDAYQDVYSAKLRLAARKANANNAAELPNSVLRQLRYEALTQECWQDVRGIVDDAGNALDANTFFNLLLDPDYFDLFEVCARAPARVGLGQQVEQEEAVKN